MLNPTSQKFILILFSHLRLGLPSGILPSSSSDNPVRTSRLPIRATCPPHLRVFTTVKTKNVAHKLVKSLTLLRYFMSMLVYKFMHHLSETRSLCIFSKFIILNSTFQINLKVNKYNDTKSCKYINIINTSSKLKFNC
jgi:hypothetical protein